MTTQNQIEQFTAIFSRYYYSHLSLTLYGAGLVVYLSRCVYVSLVTEWMDESIRHSCIISNTVAHAYTPARSHSHTHTYAHRHPHACWMSVPIAHKRSPFGQPTSYQSTTVSSSVMWKRSVIVQHFFFIFLTIAFHFRSQFTVFCAWINSLHAGDIFFHRF